MQEALRRVAEDHCRHGITQVLASLLFLFRSFLVEDHLKNLQEAIRLAE
jgi:hypothetical protein